MIKYLGSCSDFSDRFGINMECCDSCHDDYAEGRDMIKREFDNGFYIICCCVCNRYDLEK